MKYVLVLFLFFMNSSSWGQSLESEVYNMIGFIENHTELEYDAYLTYTIKIQVTIVN